MIIHETYSLTCHEDGTSLLQIFHAEHFEEEVRREYESIRDKIKDKYDWEVVGDYLLNWTTKESLPLRGLKKYLKGKVSTLYDSILYINQLILNCEDDWCYWLLQLSHYEVEVKIEKYEMMLHVLETQTFSKKQVDDLEKVKQVPITNFVTVNQAGFAKCPFHGTDKTPSLKYYPKDNHYYCFSFSEHGDVVDLVQKLNNCSFKEALSILSNYHG